VRRGDPGVNYFYGAEFEVFVVRGEDGRVRVYYRPWEWEWENWDGCVLQRERSLCGGVAAEPGSG
jgi:hypothetical protein